MLQRRNIASFIGNFGVSEPGIMLKLSLLSWACLERIGWQRVD